MNGLMSHDRDRSGGSETHSLTLSNDKEEIQRLSVSLVELWRLINPFYKSIYSPCDNYHVMETFALN